jgi:hypothetical protein
MLERELIVFSESFRKEVKRVMKEKKIGKKSAEKIAKGFISEDLGEMFLRIAQNLIHKNNFNNYTYKDDMVDLGVEYLCRFARTFNKKKANANAFSFCTQICYNAFRQTITKEKKRSQLKDDIIKENMQHSSYDKWKEKEHALER